MRRIKQFFRRKLRSWLGIDEAHDLARVASGVARSTEARLAELCLPAADVSFLGNTQIVVISRIGEGRVQFYDLNVQDSRELMERMVRIAGPSWPQSVIDAPPGFAREMKRYFGEYAPHPDYSGRSKP